MLYEFLRNENPDLADQLDTIRKEAEEIWSAQQLREFTVHGGLHFRQVEKNLNDIAAPLQKTDKRLKAEEIFILLAACYLHDIGMQLGVVDARQNHAEYAYSLILHSSCWIGAEERRVTLTIKDDNARRAIAKVARGHWTNFALGLDQEDYIHGNSRGHLRLLGVLLAHADLLDTSPVRASYYRNRHRLFDLPPLSEFHQIMHTLVHGYQIKPADPRVEGKLVYELEWQDQSADVRAMAEWLLRWFSSQHVQLAPELERLSAGAITWAAPWARVIFRRPEGPVQQLSLAAKQVLALERANQRLIDRDGFVHRFQETLRGTVSTILSLAQSSESDARELTDWCQARAKRETDCLVARVDVPVTAAIDLASLVAQVLEEWGEHLPACDDDGALRRLKDFLVGNAGHKIVLLLTADVYNENLLRPILDTVLQPSESGAPCATRLSVLVCGGETRPSAIAGIQPCEFDLSSLPRDEVEAYLLQQYGYSQPNGGQVVTKMQNLDLLSTPARVYTYIEDHCDRALWQNYVR